MPVPKVPFSRRYRDDIRGQVYDVFMEANRGRFPRCLSDWERVGRRLGLRIHIGPEVGSPHVKYNHFLSRGKVYLPQTDDQALLHVWILHEMTEIALVWEGRALCNYPPEWGGHHDLALICDGRG